MPTIVIREGTTGDLDAIERLENSVFASDRLSRRSLRHFLGAATTGAPVAVEGGVVLGYAMVAFRTGSRLARVFSLAVDGAQLRRGIGQALLGACEAAALVRGASAVRLEVRADNPAAITLYEKAGYRRFATVEDYYEDGATALRFEKRLPNRAAGQQGSMR